jgi:hypothetical protein
MVFAGGPVLARYRSSVASALAAVYPNHKWQPWKFDKTPTGFWASQASSTNMELAREFLEEMAVKLKLDSLDDWFVHFFDIPSIFMYSYSMRLFL